MESEQNKKKNVLGERNGGFYECSETISARQPSVCIEVIPLVPIKAEYFSEKGLEKWKTSEEVVTALLYKG